jgi:hypothetical protein
MSVDCFLSATSCLAEFGCGHDGSHAWSQSLFIRGVRGCIIASGCSFRACLEVCVCLCAATASSRTLVILRSGEDVFWVLAQRRKREQRYGTTGLARALVSWSGRT